MDQGIKLTKFSHSENIKLNRPYISIRIDGACYVNKKVASLLNLKHGDTISFASTDDKQNWYMCNDQDGGALINKNSGLFRFCDAPMVRNIFRAYGISGKKAFFPVSDKIQEIDGKKYLYMIPKPYNTDNKL